MANIVPITFEKFSDRRWHRFTKMDFAAGDTISPLTAEEVPSAILSMPIGFIEQQGAYRLVALQGLKSNNNLFVDDNGRWRGGYMPHYYFCYPFILIENESNTLVLCIDEDNALVTTEDDGEEFFGLDKKPAKLVSDVVTFLSGYTAQTKLTQKICSLLDQNKLIKPWPIQVQTSEGEILLEQFFCVDEERLNKLSATALKELRNGDALIVAYAQLFSMLNVNLLVRQTNDNSNADAKQTGLLSEIEFGDPDSGGLISFDNL